MQKSINHIKDILQKLPKSLSQTILPLVFAFVAVTGVAFAQSAFTQPSAPAPGNTIAPPVNTSSIGQVKGDGTTLSTGGIITTGTNGVGSSNGYTLQNANSATSTWDFEYSTTQINPNLMSSFNAQQICMAGTCITSLGSITLPVDIYLNNQSCQGHWCRNDALTLKQICSNNGLGHVLSAITGGNENSGSGINECFWTGSAWSCSSGCQSSCSTNGLTRVTCDNN
jgi:hypothetical protein